MSYIVKLRVFIFIISINFCVSQNAKNYWKLIDTKEQVNSITKNSENTKIEKSLFYELNVDSLIQILNSVSSTKKHQNKTITIPNLNGHFNTYNIKEASVLSAELQEKFPNIKSYKGQGINNPQETIRFSISPKGFHAMVLGSKEGTLYINPVSSYKNLYQIFSKKNVNYRNAWQCGVNNDNNFKNKAHIMGLNYKVVNDGFLRNYRIAIACTGEYAQFHGGTVSDVMAAMAVTMTRVNAIYERDLSVTMTMVDNTAIIFLNGATDPFTNDNANSLISESQQVINTNIGAANYDIGHTFSTGAGGLAALGSTCNNSSKALGVTGQQSPIGDPFDVDYVAHELGHQFGAPHVFNGNQSNCSGGNRSASNAYEPGSGSTIMAYAGICGNDNLQNNSDAYFHQASLTSMLNHIANTGTCPVNRTPTGNANPTANAGNNFIIPQGTPYQLIGGSTDIDGTNSHTFTWEQFDLGPSGKPSETTISGPLVRSFEGTTNPVRFIPRLQDLRFTNGSTTWEKLAQVNRVINYRLTVRDNDANGGRTATDAMSATVTTAAGPFIVTSQNTTGQVWTSGNTETITWNVAGTNGNSINESEVNILLSEDGINYDIILAENVPNDGSHDIVVPSGITSSNCRIMVEASNSIFFNINTQDIAIGATKACDTNTSGTINIAIPDNSNSGVTQSITVSENTLIESMSVNININHTYVSDLQVRLIHPNGTSINLWNQNCGNEDNINVTFEDGAPIIGCGSTINGIYQPEDSLSTFTGLSTQGQWQLFIADLLPQDTGSLVDWSIDFCSNTLSNENPNSIENVPLTIVPNPNDGSFKVRFTSKSKEDIQIDIFDMRGRLVYRSAFLNSNLFEASIKVDNVEDGLYLVKVKDGANSYVKKFVIN